MNLDKIWDIENIEENDSVHPMGVAVMGTVLPPAAAKITTRRFGLDGKHPPMSNAQVAERYGLPVNVVNGMIAISFEVIAQMGLDNTSG